MLEAIVLPVTVFLQEELAWEASPTINLYCHPYLGLLNSQYLGHLRSLTDVNVNWTRSFYICFRSWHQYTHLTYTNYTLINVRWEGYPFLAIVVLEQGLYIPTSVSRFLHSKSESTCSFQSKMEFYTKFKILNLTEELSQVLEQSAWRSALMVFLLINWVNCDTKIPSKIGLGDKGGELTQRIHYFQSWVQNLNRVLNAQAT